MKNLALFLVAFVVFGCNKKTSNKAVCITSLTYKSRKLQLIPDLIRINISDSNQNLTKKLSSYNFADQVFFYSMPENQREYFIGGSIISTKDLVTIQVTTSFFNSEHGRKVWKSNEVEKLLLQDSIGLLIGKDTIIIKSCR
ncbi:MAG: hypothetical protein H7250_07105 [Flavobacterium sp.]|nr:hypothetical protein [Flavobacterium sp.]